MIDDNATLIDSDRTTCLCDAGRPDYWAALVVAADGSEHLVLVEQGSIGDETVRYDRTCSTVVHEQLGALPIEFVRRIAVSTRTHRRGPQDGGCS